MIIIGDTYFNESVVPIITNSASGDVLSFKVGVHWVYILQSTLESAIFEGFIIYPFVLLKNVFTWG